MCRIGKASALFVTAFLATGLLVACGQEAAEESVDEAAGVRTVRIDALDGLRFEPARIEVETGQTVRFVVTNVGQIPHEFVLGDEMVQEEHAKAMQEGMEHDEEGMEHHMGEAMAAIELENPGDTMEVTVTFEEPGEFLYGCHEPGHYKGGMVGTVVVQ